MNRGGRKTCGEGPVIVMALGPQWPTGYEPLVYAVKQQDSSNRGADHVATELCCVLVGTCVFADLVSSYTSACVRPSVRVCVCVCV